MYFGGNVPAVLTPLITNKIGVVMLLRGTIEVQKVFEDATQTQ